jgi:hypothetical protein
MNYWKRSQTCETKNTNKSIQRITESNMVIAKGFLLREIFGLISLITK